MNIARVNIECFTGCKIIKQRRISFVLGYLHMILWKISTAISIKHRILATFYIKKINSDSMYVFKEADINKWELYTVVSPWYHDFYAMPFEIPRKYTFIWFWYDLLKCRSQSSNANMWKASLVVRVTLSNISAISWRLV